MKTRKPQDPGIFVRGVDDLTLRSIGLVQQEMVARGAKTNGHNSTASISRIIALVVRRGIDAHLADVKACDGHDEMMRLPDVPLRPQTGGES